MNITSSVIFIINNKEYLELENILIKYLMICKGSFILI